MLKNQRLKAEYVPASCGLLMLAAVRASGVQHIIALDGDEDRLVVGAVRSATRGRGAHFAFQCTGVPAAASNIRKYVQRGGGICEVAFLADNGNCTINPHHDICSKEISVVGSSVYTVEEYPIAYNFRRRAQGIGLPIESFITHRFPLERLQESMEATIRPEGLKVAVLPQAPSGSPD